MTHIWAAPQQLPQQLQEEKSDNFVTNVYPPESIFVEDKVAGFQQAITSFGSEVGYSDNPSTASPYTLGTGSDVLMTAGPGGGGNNPNLAARGALMGNVPDTTYYDFNSTSTSPDSSSLSPATSATPLSLAQPLEPGTGIYPGPPIAFVDPRGPHEVYNRVPLGEKGRMELKAAIRQALKNRPELREKRFVETRTGKHKRRPASTSSSNELVKTRAKGKVMKQEASSPLDIGDGMLSVSAASLLEQQQQQQQVLVQSNAGNGTVVSSSGMCFVGSPNSILPSNGQPASHMQQPASAETLDPTGWGMDWDPSLIGDSLFNTYF